MIPKTIYYVWLSDNSYPPIVELCLKSWQVFLKDYKIELVHDINLSDAPVWCVNAFKNKQYAFVTDYIRTKIMYEKGGIYLDSDCLILNNDPFDQYKHFNMWIPVEYSKTQRHNLNPAMIGSQGNNIFFKEVLDYYHQQPDNYADLAQTWKVPIIPEIYGNIMEKYGFTHENRRQFCKMNILILDDTIFNHKINTPLNAIHMNMYSWKK